MSEGLSLGLSFPLNNALLESETFWLPDCPHFHSVYQTEPSVGHCWRVCKWQTVLIYAIDSLDFMTLMGNTFHTYMVMYEMELLLQSSTSHIVTVGIREALAAFKGQDYRE